MQPNSTRVRVPDHITTTNSEVGVPLPIGRLYDEVSLNPEGRNNLRTKTKEPYCKQKLKIGVMNVRIIRFPNKIKELSELTNHNDINIRRIVDHKICHYEIIIYEKHEKSTLKLPLHGVISTTHPLKELEY